MIIRAENEAIVTDDFFVASHPNIYGPAEKRPGLGIWTFGRCGVILMAKVFFRDLSWCAWATFGGRWRSTSPPGTEWLAN
jgi:hypothetical protein